jgi:hypothetical protein
MLNQHVRFKKKVKSKQQPFLLVQTFQTTKNFSVGFSQQKTHLPAKKKNNQKKTVSCYILVAGTPIDPLPLAPNLGFFIGLNCQIDPFPISKQTHHDRTRRLQLLTGDAG